LVAEPAAAGAEIKVDKMVAAVAVVQTETVKVQDKDI
jgi:hypothetical protein